MQVRSSAPVAARSRASARAMITPRHLITANSAGGRGRGGEGEGEGGETRLHGVQSPVDVSRRETWLVRRIDCADEGGRGRRSDALAANDLARCAGTECQALTRGGLSPVRADESPATCNQAWTCARDVSTHSAGFSLGFLDVSETSRLRNGNESRLIDEYAAASIIPSARG
jgi:hypothetical protein